MRYSVTPLPSILLGLVALLSACSEPVPDDVVLDPTELCDDALDNDADSYIDCDDQDCWDAPECTGDDDDSAGDDDDSAGDDDDSAGDDDDSAGDDDDSLPPCIDVDGDGTCAADDCDDFDLALNDADVDADGASTCGGDCADDDAAINPASAELCDSVDNNCDGIIDESSASDAGTWYGDADGDGYGGAQFMVVGCVAPVGYVGNDLDCDDLDAASYPGGVEVCDQRDNDCDGSVDEDVQLSFYGDADGDGFGDLGALVQACQVPVGASLNAADCDDSAPTINPAALEICDGVDNNCDGSVDESSALDASTWFVDGDGDGFGLAGSGVQACSQPLGTAALDGDCDDALALVYPGAAELCDGIDSNCDGTAITLSWFQDADGDGYGDPGTSVNSCSQPAGFSATSNDCDDGDATTSPASFELCDGVDNDCDGLIDDADPGLPAAFATTWYLDSDGDGFGDPLLSQSACFQPTGYVADGSDCVDLLASVHPGAAELCDGVDNDCDNLLDDADPDVSLAGAPTYFTDADGDGLGDPLSPILACTQPTGAVTNNSDCDDSSALDTDGDGIQDCADDDIDGDGLPNALDADPTDPLVVTGPTAGSGSDGALVVSGSEALGLGTAVTGDPDLGDTNFDVADAASLSVGDEVLLLSHQGSDAGLFEFAFVTGINGNTLTIVPPLANDFSSSSVVAVYRVPHFTDVTVPSGATLTTTSWDGSVGGVLVFRASGDVIVDGEIFADFRGFRGGPGVSGNGSAPLQGESHPGVGSAGDTSANGGGGGAHPITGDRGECGGGGGYGGGGGQGQDSGGSNVTSGGSAYGSADLSSWHLGSGGGAGSPDAEGDGSASSNVTGSGGAGGGLVAVYCGQSIFVSGSITADGGTGADGVAGGGGEVGGGGAGSGGQIYLSAPTQTISGSVSAVGGSGGRAFGDGGPYGSAVGGTGGEGRIRLDYDTLNGVVFPGGNLSVSNPTAGHQQSPGN